MSASQFLFIGAMFILVTFFLHPELKALATEFAFVWFFLSVGAHVLFQVSGICICVITMLALFWLIGIPVCRIMFFKIPTVRETFTTWPPTWVMF